MMRQYGFTLIEVMVVVAIIGILAAVAIPAYTDYMKRSKVAEGLVLASSIEIAVADYYSHRGKFPVNNQAAGLPDPKKLQGSYVESIEIENGAIHLAFKDSNISGFLTFRPALVIADPPNNSLVWTCGYKPALKSMFTQGKNKTSIREAYLPMACLNEPRD